MERKLIFITGFFGAPLMQRAQSLAEEHGLPIVSLDAEIEKSDGRSVRRICMMMGEHELRNKEYEALKRLAECALDEGDTPRSGAVVVCGDGVLHDDMSKELILAHDLIVLGGDMSCEDLWENAKTIENSTHAFMHFGTEESKRSAFEKLYERQRVLFTPYI